MNKLKDEIMAFQFDDPDSSFKFSDRLAQENMWSKDYALRVIEEYRKFLFLGRIFGTVTPSIAVDEAWHLHMIYTKSYWQDLCRDIFDLEFHHGPTKGGKEEDSKYWSQYNRTLFLYRRYFKEDPPEDIWPPAWLRFRPDHRVRVDLDKHCVIPVGSFVGLLWAFKQYLKNKLNF